LEHPQLPQCVSCYEYDQQSAKDEVRRKIELAKEENRRQRKLLDYWQSLSGLDFEKAVAEWFERKGYSTNSTKASGDGGIDLFISRGSQKSIVQCKNWKGKVGPGPVRELFGVFNSDAGEYEKAYIVISGIFTSGAKQFAEGKPIVLIDGSELIKAELGLG